MSDQGPDLCDLCGEPIIPHVDACYCAPGKPGHPEQGPMLGDSRHYRCHVERFGRPVDPVQAMRELQADLASLRERLAEVPAALGRLRESLSEDEGTRGGGFGMTRDGKVVQYPPDD